MKGPVVRTLSVFALTAGLLGLPVAAHAAGPRIDLRVLVVTDGGPNVTAVTEQLKTEGVPYRLVDLADGARPTITTSFLQDTVSGAPRARYQAVVLPNTDPFGPGSAEMAAIVAFEKQFGIRQLSSYIYPTPDAGLNYPTYAGQLDGITGALTPSATAGAFRYLNGNVPFEDNSPTVPEVYGYLSTPLPDAAGTHFEPYLTKDGGVLAGAYTHDNRTEMVLTFSANHHQSQFRLIGHGLVTWLTKGIHLGHNRQYLSVHIDDLFLPDARWSTTANCTPGEDCDSGVQTPDIRMTPDDLAYAAAWSAQNNFTFDVYFNGDGSDEAVEQNGSDPLLTAAQQHKAAFRMANHTFQHLFLGCIQNVSVIPWACAKDALGNTLWVSRSLIRDQISKNRVWGQGKGFSQDTTELVTGEHSGLKILPQQPQDNPNLAPALGDNGVKWLGSDASRDFSQRAIGGALTVPRYPMANYFNVATAAEMVDEYNWIYTSRADGGSGICEDNPLTVTCIEPLDPATGYQDYIVPLDARIEMSHIIKNDPRPHYVHQSNMAEGRILYPLMDRVLGDYRSVFAANSPLVNQRMSANGAELKRQAAWRNTMGSVTAYLQDGRVHISGGGSSVFVPITMPEGTNQITLGLLGLITFSGPFGTPYAGEKSAYKTGNVTLQVGAQTV